MLKEINSFYDFYKQLNLRINSSRQRDLLLGYGIVYGLLHKEKDTKNLNDVYTRLSTIIDSLSLEYTPEQLVYLCHLDINRSLEKETLKKIRIVDELRDYLVFEGKIEGKIETFGFRLSENLSREGAPKSKRGIIAKDNGLVMNILFKEKE